MTDHIFSKDSWHYRLATVYQFDIFSHPKTDICSYIGQVLYGIFTALIISAGSAFLIWCAIQPWLYFLVVSWYQPTDNHSIVLSVGITIYIMAFLMGCIWVYCEKIMPYLKEHTTWYNKEEKKSFIKQAYTSWKDNYCYKITFYDPTQGGTESPPPDDEDEIPCELDEYEQQQYQDRKYDM